MTYSKLLLPTVLLAQSMLVSAKTALLIVDVQECFMDANGTSSGQAGSLAVSGTAEIIPILNEIRQEKSCLFDLTVLTTMGMSDPLLPEVPLPLSTMTKSNGVRKMC